MSDSIVSEKPLLPCPFCGAGDPEMAENADCSAFWFVCIGCDCETSTSPTRSGAVKRWNRRTLSGEREDSDTIRQRAYIAGFLDANDHAIADAPIANYERLRAFAEGKANRYAGAYRPGDLSHPIVPARSTPSEKEP